MSRASEHLGNATGLIRRARKHRHTDTHALQIYLKPPSRQRKENLNPGSIAARTPCSHDVIPVDSAIRKPAGYKRQGTRKQKPSLSLLLNLKPEPMILWFLRLVKQNQQPTQRQKLLQQQQLQHLQLIQRLRLQRLRNQQLLKKRNLPQAVLKHPLRRRVDLGQQQILRRSQQTLLLKQQNQPQRNQKWRTQTFDLEDALPEKAAEENSGNSRSTGSGAHAVGALGDAEKPEAQEASSGSVAGILSAIGVAIVGAATGYYTYRKKKLCFKNRQVLSNLLNSS
ncbi:hypothetical protein F7725_001875 [Dissostichus mawsoni]|uniref:Uncharacterized protein n=1 Tax=Dissostichus mawsoni TaxID=36200 RepID=A0A7J5Y0V9_DISMA|nr:hypothetical protein F7725_001875 [Dissostichus mawsoni]